jgi:hypothetical protein
MHKHEYKHTGAYLEIVLGVVLHEILGEFHILVHHLQTRRELMSALTLHTRVFM